MTKPVTETFVLGVLSSARDAIETGAPYYQPHPYAMAAQKGCDDAAAQVSRDGLTPDAQRLVGMAIREAARCTAHEGEAIHILAWLAQIEGRPADFMSACADYEALDKALVD